MNERHNVTTVVFGGRPGQSIQFKGAPSRQLSSYLLRSSEKLPIGMAGYQVLEWSDLDTEIKTAGVKSVSSKRAVPCRIFSLNFSQNPLSPPDL